MFIRLTSRWFSEITWKLNAFEVEGLNSQKYHNYELLAQAITNALTGSRQNISPGRGYEAFSDFGLCSTVSVSEAMGRAFVQKAAEATSAGTMTKTANLPEQLTALTRLRK